MIPKGPACRGCPLYAGGEGGFVPDDPPRGARVVIVGQNPGRNEEIGRRFRGWGANGGEIEEPCPPSPMIGKTGHDLDHTFLPRAGLARGEVECRNVIRCRWRGTNDLPPLTQTVTKDAIRHCQRAYWREPESGQVIVALGAHALWALTGELGGEKDEENDTWAARGIVGWRGWALNYYPAHARTLGEHLQAALGVRPLGTTVFVTHHPAFYYRAHWRAPVGRADWSRLGRLLRGEWPEPYPDVRTGLGGWRRFLPECVAFDTEFTPAGELTRYSLAWRDSSTGLAEVFSLPADVTSMRPPGTIIGHNLEADWPFTPRVFGEGPRAWEDTMFAHAALHGTLPHTLDFLGSIYARTNRWKHLSASDPILYSGLDALGTWDAWAGLSRELAGDPGAERAYTEELKPYRPHLLARAPVTLDAERVAAHVAAAAGAKKDIEARVAVAAGWPLNVGSPDQVARWIGLKKGRGGRMRERED